MPTKNQIIESFYQSKDFCDCIRKMEPVELQQDLKAEVILALLQTDDDKIILLDERKQLNFYAVRIIMNMIKSKTSPFYKKLRITFLEINKDYSSHDIDLGDRKSKEYKECLVLAELDITGDNEVLSFYERELVKLYLKLGNYRKIEQDTNIPWESCYKTIQSAFKKLKYYAESTQQKCNPCTYSIQTNRYDNNIIP